MKSFGKQGKRSIFAAALVVFVLAASGTAFALSGGSSLVSTSDNGTASGHAAQLGTMSASPAPLSGQGVQNEVAAGGQTPSSQNGAGNAPSNNPVVPASNSTASQLPFTGFLAIAVLLAGAGLLLGGVVIRRRAVKPAAA
jgi:hypothetical protein